MKKYEIIDHKTDLKIKSFAKTKKDIFSNMLVAMTESMKPRFGKKREKVTREIKIKSEDFKTLLVDFLNEVLYLSQTNREVYFDINFKKFSEDELRAEVSGQKINRFNEDIKAATFHNLEIEKERGVWQSTVLFDI